MTTTRTRGVTASAVGAATAALLLTPAGIALAQDDPAAPPSIVQLCAATDVQAVDTLLAGASETDLAGSLKPIASLVVPDEPDGLTLNAGVQLAEVRQALGCSDATTTTPPPAPDDPFYENCAAAIEAGVAPINRANGEAGYRPALDSDSDGIACEADEADAGDNAAPPTTSAPSTTTDPATGGGFSQLDQVPTRAAETGGGPA